ncbi:methyl-accepting chemotaxis protein [Kamptonema sp. UHCC 0994]|uniref:methyl-accepting chemotaxis protein n=1 Tax=Kamptonema sp. UHCC 0994 TaxID=3031329 RepID=UPI0023BAE2AE|nr:methyl-accepting chemotaxis protein [Kamptonema sp. UHCC 0994]MDF0556971.1 methyl-accepting chemotaxis protein [Kamptonema sp. UHCC 0994]
MSTIKKSSFTRILGKFPLQVILIVPFVVQIVSFVGLVGYLSFRNGQKAINDLASQLQNEVSLRTIEHLDRLLATPPQINQINVDAYELGNLNLQNLDGIGRYFYKQMQVFKNLGYMNFADITGGFVGIGREDDGTLYLELIRPGDPRKYKRYALDNQGKPIRVIATEEYDYNNEGWYTNAVKAGKPIWSEIYNWDDRPEIVSISSSYPVYDQNRKLVCVMGIDLILTQINSFLESLKVSPAGRVFIFERSGLFVATSSKETLYRMNNKKAERLKIVESKDPLIQATAQNLVKRFDDFSQIATDRRFDFNLTNDRAFVQVIPWRDKLGLDWLIVVVIPESDFMGQINANTRTTILLNMAALVIAIVVGILTTEPLKLVISEANQVVLKITLSTTQIADASKQLEGIVTAQAASTTEVNSTAQEIADTSGKLVKKVENIVQKVQATAKLSSNSQTSLMEMSIAMSQLAQSTKLISARLGVMLEKANNINSVVKIIANLADVMQLISLNATIEAEKAAQNGLGFSVVAKEITRIADKMGFASVEIQLMVKEIQSSVSDGVIEMRKFSKEVSNHLEQVGKIAGEVNLVIEQVQNITPSFEEVSDSMEQQFEGAGQISLSIAHLSESSKQIVQSLTETNQVLDQLDDTAQILRGIISSSVKML